MSVASITGTTVLLAALTLAVAGCGSKDSSTASGDDASSTPASTSGGSSTTAATDSAPAGGSACDSFSPGEGGIIQTFCDGTATAKITIDGATTTLSGGECDMVGGKLAINIGVVAGPDYTGTKPDYLGAILPGTVGAFTKAAFSGSAGGTSFLLPATGTIGADFSTVTASGMTFEGTSATVDVTC